MKRIMLSIAAACAALTLAAGSAPAQAHPIHAVYHGGYHGGWGHGGWGRGGWYGGRWWPGAYWGGVGLGLGIGLGTGYYVGAAGYPGYPVYAEAPPVVYDAPQAVYAAPAVGTPVPSVAARAPDPVIYPRNGQSASRLEADRRECNRWATSQPNAMADGNIFQRATQACMDGRGYTVR